MSIALCNLIVRGVIMRLGYLFLLAVVFVLVIGCGGGSGNGGSPGINRNAQAYFPLNVGDMMTYVIVNAPDTDNLWSTSEPHTYTVSQIQLELEGLPPEMVYYLDLTPIPLNGTAGNPVGAGLLCEGTVLRGRSWGVGSHASVTSSDITILPDPTPNVGDTWFLAAAFGDWTPGLPFDIDTLMYIEATATLAAVENITVQGHVYANALRVDVTGEMNFPITLTDHATILGTGSYWLAENVGVVAIEANCGGWFTDSVRIERVP